MRSVESFVARVVEDLEKKSEERRPVIVRRKVSTIISQCGYSRRSERLLAELDRAIEEAHIFVDPVVTDTGLGLDTWIRFTNEPPPSQTQTFQKESALGYHLSKYPDRLAQALGRGSLTLKHGGKKPEKKFVLDGEYVKPDLVFRSADGSHVVCELKVGDPTDRSVSQLLKYVEAADATYQSSVVGVLVTGQPRLQGTTNRVKRHLEELSRGGRDLRWFWYDVRTELVSPT
jgi:hypothetical protein